MLRRLQPLRWVLAARIFAGIQWILCEKSVVSWEGTALFVLERNVRFIGCKESVFQRKSLAFLYGFSYNENTQKI